MWMLKKQTKRLGKIPARARIHRYAGWGAGQLEAEMKQNAWVIPQTGPRHTETRSVAQALVRHHAPAGSLVQAAGRSAGRSIFKLNYGA